jgi:hypothetical protein
MRTQRSHRGSGGGTPTQENYETRETPAVAGVTANRTPARDRPGRLGRRKGS